MKLLAFSDIHNNLVAVRKMRAIESNTFDAIIVAGDIGNDCAVEFFRIVKTFKCPIGYVFGNWDHDLGYRKSFETNCHLIHLNVFKVGIYSFVGFSGCPTNWGKNPFALRRRAAETSILEKNRSALGNLSRRAGLDPQRTIVVTHERLGHLRREIPSALLHIFGHIHKFSDHDYMGTKYVNVAALDRQISARPRSKLKWSAADCRNYNTGNYTTIEINSSLDITVKRVDLQHDYKNWIPISNCRFNGIEWIPEEQKWAKSSDPRLLKYEVRRSR